MRKLKFFIYTFLVHTRPLCLSSTKSSSDIKAPKLISVTLPLTVKKSKKTSNDLFISLFLRVLSIVRVRVPSLQTCYYYCLPLCECLSVKPEQVDPQPPEASVVQIPQLLHFLNNGWIVVVVRIGIVPWRTLLHMSSHGKHCRWYGRVGRSV